MKIKICILTLLASFLFITLPALAKEINLYDQPTTNAKVVATVDPAVGIIPIFSPKNGDWIKIGDPRNGNVGWVKTSDLKSIKGPVTFTQKVTNTENGPQAYQIIQYGQTPQLTNEQIQKIQQQQQLFQQSVQKIIQDMMNDMNNLFPAGFSQHDFNVMNGSGNFPLIVPIIVVPEKSTQQQKQPLKHPTPAPTSTTVNPK